MKFTNTEVEDLIEKIISLIIDYKMRMNFSMRTSEDVIEEIGHMCKEFKDKYICPYEKYTTEWYDEHGE
jgi:hypothetical protein